MSSRKNDTDNSKFIDCSCVYHCDCGPTPLHAEMSAEELAKIAQNPVGNPISVPFQNNTNLNYGPEKGTQNLPNIQPVIPVSINKDWNIIARTILPVIWQPVLGPGDSSVSGIGDLQFNAFLSPAKPAHGMDMGRGCYRPGAYTKECKAR